MSLYDIYDLEVDFVECVFIIIVKFYAWFVEVFIDFRLYFFPSTLGFISNISTHRQYFPDEEDATGAAKALMRLQDTYQLDSEAFARGNLPGKECEIIRLPSFMTIM